MYPPHSVYKIHDTGRYKIPSYRDYKNDQLSMYSCPQPASRLQKRNPDLLLQCINVWTISSDSNWPEIVTRKV